MILIGGEFRFFVAKSFFESQKSRNHRPEEFVVNVKPLTVSRVLSSSTRRRPRSPAAVAILQNLTFFFVVADVALNSGILNWSEIGETADLQLLYAEYPAVAVHSHRKALANYWIFLFPAKLELIYSIRYCTIQSSEFKLSKPRI